MTTTGDPEASFIEASVWHGSLDRAQAILAAHPSVAGSSVHTAAILGDEGAVRRFIALDPGNATATGGPRAWDALTHLCFSKYLRLDRARSEGFVGAATALLDAGANANTGFHEPNHQPEPEWESALYGAAGVAHHAGLTRLLLERGANPNDEEAVYHSPETWDNAAMKLLVETGKLTDDNLALMLIRKHDWHDYEGVAYLLGKGIDVNRKRDRGRRPLHHAIARDNDLAIIELLFDHGADPMVSHDGMSAVALAACKGRRGVLESIERRGIPFELRGVERLIAACAKNDTGGISAIVEGQPQLVHEVVEAGGTLLAQFAGVANTDGVVRLLDLGVPVDALFIEGDGYFDEAKNSTALHVAAWRARHATVRMLIERGAAVDALDDKGRTPLALAVKACVDSYWTDRRSPESVEALLSAGASVTGVAYPSGYAEADASLGSHGARERSSGDSTQPADQNRSL